MRVAALAYGLMLAGFAADVPALAQSATCLRLQNQLSALDSGITTQMPANNGRYRQYGRAIKDQHIQIKKTTRMARRNGCRAGLFSRRNTSTCGRILDSLEKMNANLAALQREYRLLERQNTGANDQNRRALIKAMNQRGCLNNNQRRSTNIYPRRRSLIEQIFGVRTFGNDGRRGYFEQPDYELSSRYNTYRTMCVREQDGYYFPVSFSTTPDRFEFDERICQSKCPGKKVSLYYHQMPAQDSEDMIAFRGQLPYADLPTAFAYRKKFDPEATCRYSAGIIENIETGYSQNQLSGNISDAPLRTIGRPVFRSDRSLDPETRANQGGLFGEIEISQLLISPGQRPAAQAPGGRKVRVVGPKFYPVQ